MTYFISSTNPGFNAVVQKVYEAAKAYAASVQAAQGVAMAVERLRPVHLGLTSTYAIPYNSGSLKSYTLKTNCGVFLAGLYSNSTNLKELNLYNGVNFLGIWSVREVVKYQEQSGAYAGNLKSLEFKSNETIKTHIVATYGQAGTADEDAWFIGFAVMPESSVNTSIVG